MCDVHIDGSQHLNGPTGVGLQWDVRVTHFGSTGFRPERLVSVVTDDRKRCSGVNFHRQVLAVDLHGHVK